MKHVYLTKEEIDRSYREGAITVREAKELLAVLDQQAKIATPKVIVNHENATHYQAA